MTGGRRLRRLPAYLADIRDNLPDDPVWRQRLERREAKVRENPEHHGLHLSRENHCNWAAGVGRFFIIYNIDKTSSAEVITLLAFYKGG
jgi:mRNA-degrading endonuclease RelE of RelBE toxin-antitoxin system